MSPKEQEEEESSASATGTVPAATVPTPTATAPIATEIDNDVFQKLLQNTEILLNEAKETFATGDLNAAIDKYITLLELHQNSFQRTYTMLALLCHEIAACFHGKPKFEEEAIAFCKHGIDYCDVGKVLLPEDPSKDETAAYFNTYKKKMKSMADDLMEKLPYNKAIFWRRCGYLVARSSKPSIGKALLYEEDIRIAIRREVFG